MRGVELKGAWVMEDNAPELTWKSWTILRLVIIHYSKKSHYKQVVQNDGVKH
jgi:uncharacterized protein with HEPN domain